MLRQVLPLFVLPIGLTLMLIGAGLAFRKRWLVITASLGLWLCSTPLVGGTFGRAIEGGQTRALATSASAVDAIVVLRTGRGVAPGPARISEWSDADRFFAGVELFKAHRAPILVFTGGASPLEPDAVLEGDVLIANAESMGIPRDRMMTTTRVINTAEEAAAVRSLLSGRMPQPARVLLVTSAFHMPRARQLFANAGFVVEAFPVDFASSGSRGLRVIDLLPTADALGQTQNSLRELYGRLYYRVRPL